MAANDRYEVLSPWAEADPVPSKGITPRLTSLEGKKIGLLANAKRASRPILSVVERRLKERLPAARTSWYFTQFAVGPPEIDTDNRPKFEDWLKGVDAVVAAVGD
jgi:hypothetical protein